MIIFPRCFSDENAISTEVLEGYNPPSNATPRSSHWHNAYDSTVFEGRPWCRYLLQLGDTTGTVNVSSRGCQLAIAVGQHCAAITFGPSSSIIEVSPEELWDLTNPLRDIPSLSSSDPNCPRRSFNIPLQYNEPRSRDTHQQRAMNIFLAVVCKDMAWVVVDAAESRDVRLHILSKTVSWQELDLQVDSQTWPGQRVFQSTWLGADWTLEPYRALTALYRWRTAVQYRLPSSGFDRPIVLVISTMPGIFNGFGMRSACDVLFAAGIWPLMPAWVLCGLHDTSSSKPTSSTGDVLFAHFAETLRQYSAQWASPDFLTLCAVKRNKKNPLAYPKTAVEQFYTGYMTIFQKRMAKLPNALWDEYENKGLLCADHIIGGIYESQPSHESDRVSVKLLPVFELREGDITAYTVIRARPPAEWNIPLYTSVKMEIDKNELHPTEHYIPVGDGTTKISKLNVRDSRPDASKRRTAQIKDPERPTKRRKPKREKSRPEAEQALADISPDAAIFGPQEEDVEIKRASARGVFDGSAELDLVQEEGPEIKHPSARELCIAGESTEIDIEDSGDQGGIAPPIKAKASKLSRGVKRQRSASPDRESGSEHGPTEQREPKRPRRGVWDMITSFFGAYI
ncbi:hypothetical protein PHLGIDRAFT_157418 [Phlebiopsis gigantea 11061_1 CR5-6]|uniref:Uncharacterized protein n=1 Tax=Phlebiopsis gigantea (strain 11061_1 CR5-6) TaxID=745531 RepID=A0A0C3P080_PHLG1|nr:hypothetical protein PHLGIDRAFT_157418 [Phlebiopsis gigantea 11061_1 CR5-6]